MTTNIVIWLVIATVVLFAALFAGAFLFRRRVRHMDWLNRLEKLKTEHIYAAYNEIKQKACGGDKNAKNEGLVNNE